eukprot:1760693-Pyramimonas_sp.AAC.1
MGRVPNASPFTGTLGGIPVGATEECDGVCQNGARTVGTSGGGATKCAPRGPQERLKRVPEASDMSSRGPYDGPKRPTRRSQLSILTALR